MLFVQESRSRWQYVVLAVHHRVWSFLALFSRLDFCQCNWRQITNLVVAQDDGTFIARKRTRNIKSTPTHTCRWKLGDCPVVSNPFSIVELLLVKFVAKFFVIGRQVSQFDVPVVKLDSFVILWISVILVLIDSNFSLFRCRRSPLIWQVVLMASFCSNVDISRISFCKVIVMLREFSNSIEAVLHTFYRPSPPCLEGNESSSRSSLLIVFPPVTGINWCFIMFSIGSRYLSKPDIVRMK